MKGLGLSVEWFRRLWLQEARPKILNNDWPDVIPTEIGHSLMLAKFSPTPLQQRYFAFTSSQRL